MVNLFRVGVHLSMTSNAPQMLGALAQHFLHLNLSASQLQGSLNKIGIAAVGAGAALGGIMLVKGVWHSIEAAKELNTELSRTALLAKAATNADGTINRMYINTEDLRRQAFKAADEVRTLDPAQAVKMERELAGQIGSHEDAFKILPFAARLAYGIKQFTGADSESAMRDAVKVADLRGSIFARGPDGKEHVDVSKLQAEMEGLADGIKASGGMLKASDYLAFAKQSGLAGKAMDPKTFYGYATEAMVAMGASRAGTATNSLFQQFQAGTASADHWREMAAKSGGVIKEGRDFVVGKGGHTKITDTGRKDMHLDDMKKNEFKWVNDFLEPMLEKGGVKSDQMLVELASILGRATTQRLVGEVMLNRSQFERTAQIFDQVQPVDQSAQYLHDHDFETNQVELAQAWKGFMDAIGGPGIPLAIQVMHGLGNAIHWMTDMAVAHPTAVQWMLGFAAAFGVLLALGGTIAVVTVAFGPFTAALGMLIGTMGGASAAATGATALATSFGGLLAAILALAGPVAAFLYVMRPSETNKGEKEGLENLHSMTPLQQKTYLDPKGWVPPPAQKAGVLDGALDWLGIHRDGGVPAAAPPTPAAWGPSSPGWDTAPKGPNGVPIQSVKPTPPPPQPLTVQTTLTVDGRVLAKAVNQYNGQAMGAPDSTGSGFNRRGSPSSTVGGY